MAQATCRRYGTWRLLMTAATHGPSRMRALQTPPPAHPTAPCSRKGEPLPCRTWLDVSVHDTVLVHVAQPVRHLGAAHSAQWQA